MKILIQILLILTVSVVNAQNTNYIDSLNALPDAVSDEEIKKSIPQYISIYRVAEKQEYSKGIIESCYKLGNLYKEITNTDSSLYFYNLAIKYSTIANSPRYTAKCYSKKGITFLEMRQLDSSLYCLHRAIDISQKIQDNESEINKYNFILGEALFRAGEYDKSKKILEKVLQYATQNEYESLILPTLNSLGSLYYEQGKYREALNAYRASIKYIVDDPRSMSITYNNLSTTFEELNELDSAIYYIRKSLAISKQNNNMSTIVSGYNNLAKILEKQNKKPEALNLYHKALKIADSLNFVSDKVELNLNLSNSYKSIKEFEKSLYHFEKYNSIRDSIFNTEKSKIVLEMQSKYESAQKEKALLELSAKNEQAKNELNMTVLISVVVLLLTFTVFYIINRKRKLEQIKQQNDNKLAISNAMVDGEENERKRIAQEIHDNLGSLLGITRMIFSSTKSIWNSDQQLYEKIDNLLKQANETSRKISHELYSHSLKHSGLIAAIEDHLALIRMANPNLNANLITAGDDINANYGINLNLYRITQELLNNTIKYAEATEVTISIEKSNKTLIYRYKDNGKGFEKNKISEGIGLKSIKARTNRFKGSISIESNSGKGMNVQIQLPHIT